MPKEPAAERANRAAASAYRRAMDAGAETLEAYALAECAALGTAASPQQLADARAAAQAGARQYNAEIEQEIEHERSTREWYSA